MVIIAAVSRGTSNSRARGYVLPQQVAASAVVSSPDGSVM